ncbi:monocarboxylate transporter 2 [Fusarium albosuccineum]|uniref:Monocarboxylate transporter 2 n=1 Tax=Fusarium albosuccineum TaxID=1237068 RepID=A0A8H4L1J7_9HYPO|nr:monocarboxylate transporter 2 [Fusarium albosuccineum]
MADLDVVRSVNSDRVGAVFEVDDDNDRESRVTDARQRDIESTLPPWICVLGAFLFAIPSFGFMQSVGTLQSYLKLNQLSEYSTGDIGWITGMYMFLSYFFNIQVGPICDHYGPMVVGPIGVVMTVASFLVLAECTTYWQLMLCLGIFGSLGGAVIATAAMSVIGKLFTRRQGLAMGVALTGSSVGAILILAFTIAGIIIPGLLCFVPFEKLARSLPNQATSRSGGPAGAVINFAAFRSTPFSFVTGGSFLLEFAIFGIAGLLPTIATNTGFSPEDGYTLLSILGVGSCIGRILPGLFGDLVGPFNVILIMTATTLLFMATLFIPFANKSESVLYAFSALWGFGSGSFLSVTPVCVGKTCEARDYGRFYGTWTFFVSFSVLLAIPLSGLLLDSMGTQALAGLLTAVVFLGGVCYVAARALMVGKLLSPKIKM